MAFLKILGKTLSYKNSEKERQKLREQALNYMLNWQICYDKEQQDVKSNTVETKFGYEMEVQKIRIDDDNKTVMIDLSGDLDIEAHSKIKESNFSYQVEYGKWMVEVIPNSPFQFKKLSDVETNMIEMKEDFNRNLGKNNFVYLSVFPLLGVGKDYYYIYDVDSIKYENEEARLAEIEHRKKAETNDISKSEYTHDIITTNHPRFQTFSQYSRERTGKNPCILVPIYKDKYTEQDVIDEKYPGYIHGDSFGIGMGNGCLQITAGMECFAMAKYAYDQLIPIIPIITALSASSPFFKGKLSGFDNRFQIISQGCDERTEEEKDPNSEKYLFCSRYSFIYSYISNNHYIQEHHNDLPKMPINEEYHKKLLQKYRKNFATYLCNLLVRDPMLVYESNDEIEDNKDPSSFLNFMSTNWNSLRFKPPLSNDNDSLFKIEIRPCDLQITPFENAAIVSFIMVYIEMIKVYDINFIAPLSKIKENFERGVLIDAVTNEKFYWRMNSIPKDYKNSSICKFRCEKNIRDLPDDYLDAEEDYKNNIKEVNIATILNGDNEGKYPGLLSLMTDFTKERFSGNELKKILSHLELLKLRSEGKLLSDARYLRNFVLNHRDYKQNSIITKEINYDLMKEVLLIQNGEKTKKEIFGDLFIN